MNCSQVRKVLYPEPEKCALTIEHAAAVDHVRECADCSRYFQEQREWARTLKEKAGRDEAPTELRDHVEGTMTGKAGAPVGSRKRWGLAAVAAVAFAILPLIWMNADGRSESFFRYVCEDHARSAAGRTEIQSGDPLTVESWLRRATEYAVRVPSLENLELIGGRLCFLQDKKAALVLYRKEERPLSLFQLSEDEVDLRALDRSVIDGAPIWRGSFQGFNVAAFPARGMVYVLVSDLREIELLELASEARLQSRAY